MFFVLKLVLKKLRPSPHYAREIWKRRNQLCILHLCLRKARSGNHVIIVTSSCSKSYVCSLCKMSFVLTETKSRRPFQNPPAGEEAYVFEKLPFWRISVDSKPNRRNKAAFSNFSFRISVDGTSAVPTTRALNLDFPLSRIAKAEHATRKMSETAGIFCRLQVETTCLFELKSNKPQYKG